MSKATIKAAAEKAARNGETLQLWQAAIWMEDYKLITHQELTAIEKAINDAKEAIA